MPAGAPFSDGRSSYRMRILIVSHHFPPFNTMGAVRVGKMAKYLQRFGHDVRVISAFDQVAHGQPVPQTLPLPIEDALVLRTKWVNIMGPFQALRSSRGEADATGTACSQTRPSLRSLALRPLRNLAQLGTLIDSRIGWLPFAIAEADKLLASWTPEIIYASAWPLTSLFVARAISRKHHIPWVAELRDPWSDNPYAEGAPCIRALALRQECKVLSSAAGIVTVSDPWVRDLKARHAKPTALVFNGYDPEDFPTACEVPFSEGIVRITYTGQLYSGRRDPTPLFQAMARLGPLVQKVRVSFYGPHPQLPLRLAQDHGVQDQVEANGSVPYKEALRVQCESDVLLLLTWNDPREHGFCSGKLFEYMGARRPILTIGSPDSVSAQIVTQRGVGVVSSEPDQIAAYLGQWISIKEQTGSLPSPPAGATDGFTRESQARRLGDFLLELVGNSGTGAM